MPPPFSTWRVVVRQHGRHIAPSPLVEHTVASRLLASIGVDDLIAPLASGERIATIALRPAATVWPASSPPARWQTSWSRSTASPSSCSRIARPARRARTPPTCRWPIEI